MGNSYFVTGAQGCIGAWVVKRLIERGDEVVVFDKSDDAGRLRAVMDEPDLARVEFRQGDITELEAVCAEVKRSGARRLIHLAGLQVPFCQADPALGAAVNVVGTVNMFQAALATGIERVAYASSAAVYSTDADIERPTERDACEPATHYGVYKRANEGSARVFFENDGLSSVGLRPLTVYGVGRDQGLTSGPTRAMKAAVVGQPFTIAFSGATDFQYVADTADTFIACADRGPRGAHVWNLTGDCIAISDIVGMIEEMIPSAAGTISIEGPPIPIPPALDGAAIKAAMPGIPYTPIEVGMKETIRRFRDLLAAGCLGTEDLEN